jgi:hypothetical protein
MRPSFPTGFHDQLPYFFPEIPRKLREIILADLDYLCESGGRETAT